MPTKTFYSPQLYDHKLSFTPIDGYTTYRYALFQSKGIGQFFDFLRYERAFLPRRRDVDILVELMQDFTKATLDRIEVMVCRHAWGRRSPEWTYGRLMSGQRLADIESHKVYDMDCDFTAPKPSKKLKVRSDIEITGTLELVLNTMYQNQAMPNTEGDAHTIEHWQHRPGEEQTVSLTRFVPTEQEWLL